MKNLWKYSGNRTSKYHNTKTTIDGGTVRHRDKRGVK